MVQHAGGPNMTRAQATNVWDKTIFPLGRKVGLLTGYVAAQEGTSKRSAAGNPELQRQWYEVVSGILDQVKAEAQEVLQDPVLVKKMLPSLVNNLDEECLHALAKCCLQ